MSLAQAKGERVGGQNAQQLRRLDVRSNQTPRLLPRTKPLAKLQPYRALVFSGTRGGTRRAQRVLCRIQRCVGFIEGVEREIFLLQQYVNVDLPRRRSSAAKDTSIVAWVVEQAHNYED